MPMLFTGSVCLFTLHLVSLCHQYSTPMKGRGGISSVKYSSYSTKLGDSLVVFTRLHVMGCRMQ